jgi:hypothetical protein
MTSNQPLCRYPKLAETCQLSHSAGSRDIYIIWLYGVPVLYLTYPVILEAGSPRPEDLSCGWTIATEMQEPWSGFSLQLPLGLLRSRFRWVHISRDL